MGSGAAAFTMYDFEDMFLAFLEEQKFFMGRDLVNQLREDTIIGRDEHGFWFRQPEDPPERRRRAVEH